MQNRMTSTNAGPSSHSNDTKSLTTSTHSCFTSTQHPCILSTLYVNGKESLALRSLGPHTPQHPPHSLPSPKNRDIVEDVVFQYLQLLSFMNKSHQSANQHATVCWMMDSNFLVQTLHAQEQVIAPAMAAFTVASLTSSTARPVDTDLLMCSNG